MAAGASFETGSRRAPVTDNAGGRIFQPAEALAGKVTANHRHQRHHHMPFAEHPPAVGRRIIAPVSELRANGHQSPDKVT
ncbi:hypothetical protein D3C87_1526940 [compost metagenome]